MQTSLAFRAPVARPARAGVARPQRVARSVLVRSAPKQEDVEKAIRDAEEACAGGVSGECANAWDTVEELSAAAAHAKAASSSKDPLEDKRVQDCEADPSQPECRVYDE